MKNTKVMMVSKQQAPQPHVIIGNCNLQNVHKFKYLGYIINDQCDFPVKVRSRIAQGRQAFMKIKQVLSSQSLEYTAENVDGSLLCIFYLFVRD